MPGSNVLRYVIREGLTLKQWTPLPHLATGEVSPLWVFAKQVISDLIRESSGRTIRPNPLLAIRPTW